MDRAPDSDSGCRRFNSCQVHHKTLSVSFFILKLKEFASSIKNVEKVELLPYKTIGVHKYQTLNLKYRLDGVPELSKEKLEELNSYLNN